MQKSQGMGLLYLVVVATNLSIRVWIGWIDFEVFPGNLSRTVALLLTVIFECLIDPFKIDRT